MELVRLVYGPMCRNDSCMYGCKVAFLMYILIPFCRKCSWLCIFHEEFCEKDKFAYHIVDILRNLLFFMVYLLWTVFPLNMQVLLRSNQNTLFRILSFMAIIMRGFHVTAIARLVSAMKLCDLVSRCYVYLHS